jgi:hypothetical protein
VSSAGKSTTTRSSEQARSILAEADIKPGGDSPRVAAGSTGPAIIRAVIAAINERTLPAVYVTDGQVVHVEEISGAAAPGSGEDNAPLPVAARELNRHGLAALLARHTFNASRRPPVSRAKVIPGFRCRCQSTPHRAAEPAAKATGHLNSALTNPARFRSYRPLRP